MVNAYAVPKKPRQRPIVFKTSKADTPDSALVLSRSELRERVENALASVTLDGKPARIAGWGLPVATVATLPDGPAFEYSWAAVSRITTERNGAFKS